MQFKEGMQTEYERRKATNKDEYGKAVYRYLEKWANLMEEALARGETIEMMAEETSNEADTEGITGFMYGCAVDILAHCWEHGEQLRIWHNAQYGAEGAAGVVNPAIISVSVPEDMSDEQFKGHLGDIIEESGVGRMMSNPEFKAWLEKSKKKTPKT